MHKDLRSMIEELEREHGGELIRIDKGPLNPAEGECAAILQQLEDAGKMPMVIFEHVTNLHGQRWPGSVVYQTDGTWTRLAIEFGMPDATSPYAIQQETLRRIKRPLPSMVIDPKVAPVKARVVRQPEISFFDLPGYRSNEQDARPGWITGPVVARDPDSGRYNVSWHRDFIASEERALCNMEPRHLSDILAKHRERGEDWAPFVQVFGHNVLWRLAASMRPGLDVDEYDFAGGILGEPLRVTPSDTWGEQFMIPADAEVVIEGYIATRERGQTGPWADFLRYYAPTSGNPVLRLAAVNMRTNPMFEHSWVGHDVSEDIATAAYVQQMLSSRFPGVRAVNYVLPGMMVLQFKPTRNGDVGRMVGLAHAYGDIVKHVIVVDEDVDPFDPYQVLWSIASRVDAKRRTYVVPLSTHRLDPAVPATEVNGQRVPDAVGALVIDSTKPIESAFVEVGHAPASAVKKIALSDYVSQEELAGIVGCKTTRPWAMTVK
ncbi:MAG: UbiD family decarboxylase [Chloroflexi bacterium]|nr:UbiD family decarboxylase [Chloroflexota bacterium]